MTAPDVNADVRARFEAELAKLPAGAQANIRYAMSRDESLSFNMFAAGYRAAHADLSGEVRELVEAVCSYRSALVGMNSAMQDGVNVHGALSALYGAEENLDAALAKVTQEKP